MDTVFKITPGDKVTSNAHPDRGVGTASWVSSEKGEAFVYWGAYGDMVNRTSAVCKLNQLNKHDTDHNEGVVPRESK